VSLDSGHSGRVVPLSIPSDAKDGHPPFIFCTPGFQIGDDSATVEGPNLETKNWWILLIIKD